MVLPIPSQFIWRTPTVSITIEGKNSADVAKFLGTKGIFTYHGHFYAIELTEKLGVETSVGLLRIGLAHSNSLEEINQYFSVLVEL